jgi:hypothetical protein
MKFSPWVRLPAQWIGDHRLTEFKWGYSGAGADELAALMTLIAVAHSVDPHTGSARLTYDTLTTRACLSRAKLARGLTVLQERRLIVRPEDAARSMISLTDYDQVRWAKLPFRSMYRNDRIAAFHEFTLRKPIELDAIKLFLLFAQRRDNSSNMAKIGYDKIELYTAIPRTRIKSAISYLVSHLLIHIEQLQREDFDVGIAQGYRLVGIDPHNHMGTGGRGMLQA